MKRAALRLNKIHRQGSENVSRTYRYEELLQKTAAVLRSFGYSSEDAGLTARVLAEAEARGVPSQGIGRLKLYRSYITDGFVKPVAKPEIVKETPVSLTIDGHDGIGYPIAEFAVRHCIEKAQNSGVALCAVRRTSHYGMAGVWAEEIAAAGMIGVTMTTTKPNAMPTHGKTRMLGTNPIAVAIPAKDGAPFLLDMATTTAAFGKVRVYERTGKPLPPGWAADMNGQPITDGTEFLRQFSSQPTLGGLVFLGGMSEEMGGHKGYGLGLLVELLCAGLSMGGWSFHALNKANNGGGAGISSFFAAIRMDLFGDEKLLRGHIAAILDEIRASEPAEGCSRVYIHGEKEREAREHAMTHGLVIDTAASDMLEELYAALPASEK